MVEVRYSADEVTPHQLDLATQLESELRRRARYIRFVESDDGNGPCIAFRVATRSADLAVSFALYQDSFHIMANEAEVRVQLPNSDSYESWAETVVTLTSELLERPLRIRVKQPSILRWLPAEGAIYLTYGAQGSWAGSIALGRGRETVYEDWYVPA